MMEIGQTRFKLDLQERHSENLTNSSIHEPFEQ